MIQYYNVKQNYTLNEPGSQDYKGHSRNYLEIISQRVWALRLCPPMKLPCETTELSQPII